VPGFRKGKVPATLVRRQFGEEINRELIERIVPRYWRQAAAEKSIDPLGPPRVADVHYHEGEAMTFTAEVEVRPEFELRNYKDFALPTIELEPSKEEVDAALAGLRRSQAEWRATERAAATGDRAQLELVETTEGGTAADAEPRTATIEIGSPRTWEELNLAATGLSVGQSARFTRREGEGEQATERSFELRLVGLEEPHLPALDDEFARKIGKHQSFEALSLDVTERLRSARREEVDAERQRLLLDQINKWNQGHQAERADDSRLAARLAQYELAYRMQTAAPELMDVSPESQATRDLYGLDHEPTAKFGRMCLLARRMVERGVRYVQLYNNDWDGHGECAKNHEANARRIDQPIAALIADLKQRGLLDETLLVWTGEFGRTPVMQGSKGRDHNPYGFTTWLCGGGIRGGKTIGATDEFGFKAVEDKVHVNDLHAALLSLLGLDHEKLTYLFEGREHRLTDVGGHNNLAEKLSRA
jgi:trigger factor